MWESFPRLLYLRFVWQRRLQSSWKTTANHGQAIWPESSVTELLENTTSSTRCCLMVLFFSSSLLLSFLLLISIIVFRCCCCCFQILKVAGHGLACDVWSVGVMAFALVAGEFPWYSGVRDICGNMIKYSELKFPQEASKLIFLVFVCLRMLLFHRYGTWIRT